MLRTLRAQLDASLGPPDHQQLHPFGVSMVEELLPDSFLKHALGAFMQMLQVGAARGLVHWGCADDAHDGLLRRGLHR